MFYTTRSDVHFYEIGRHLTVMFVSRIVSTVEEKLEQEAVKTACTRALTFLRSFVAGKANFCSHLLASVVHFTVVKS